MPKKFNQITAALLTLGALSAGERAQAEANPYYLGTSLGLTHVSNIYRTPSGTPANNDTVTSGTLLAGINQQFGRQRLFGDASVSANSYKNNKELRNTSYSLNAGLDWQTVERLSGQFGVISNRSLAQFNPGDAPTLTKKNVAQQDEGRASVRYGLVTLLSLDASLSHRRRTYTAEEFAAYELSQDTGSIGLSYRPSASLSLGLAGRSTKGKYPKAGRNADGFVADSFKRHDVDLTVAWVPSVTHAVNLRLSSGKTNHEQVSARNFSGTTGALNWRWVPTSKLTFSTSLSRDSGTETSFISLGALGSLNADYSRLTTAAQVKANYQLTSKILLDANVGVYERNLVNTVGSLGRSGEDRTTTAGLSLRWLVTRSTLLGCQLTHDRRTGQSAFSLPFSANSMGCYGQLTLQ